MTVYYGASFVQKQIRTFARYGDCKLMSEERFRLADYDHP